MAMGCGGSGEGGGPTGGSTAGTVAGGGAGTGGNVTGGSGGSASGGVATGGRAGSDANPTGGSAGRATGGHATGGGGAGGTAGLASGGTTASGGATGGSTGGGGAAGGAGGGAAGSEGPVIDCNATMPTSGGTQHSGNSQGGSGSTAWSLWQNGNGGSITTYNTTAFAASWGPNSGDFLSRIGLEWGGSGKNYDQYGSIVAQFAYKKTGTAGGYSYIGIYGWSNNPCVEYYIVDDSYGKMPFDAFGATLKGTANIDGEDYKLFSNNTRGTGGSRCNAGESSWLQFWSIRQKARQCGQISISKHFDAWKEKGMVMGKMLEAKILVEVGGGTGTIEFPIASVTAK